MLKFNIKLNWYPSPPPPPKKNDHGAFVAIGGLDRDQTALDPRSFRVLAVGTLDLQNAAVSSQGHVLASIHPIVKRLVSLPERRLVSLCKPTHGTRLGELHLIGAIETLDLIDMFDVWLEPHSISSRGRRMPFPKKNTQPKQCAVWKNYLGLGLPIHSARCVVFSTYCTISETSRYKPLYYTHWRINQTD